MNGACVHGSGLKEISCVHGSGLKEISWECIFLSHIRCCDKKNSYFVPLY